MIKHHEKEIAKTDVFEHQHSSTKRTLFFGRVIRIGPKRQFRLVICHLYSRNKELIKWQEV